LAGAGIDGESVRVFWAGQDFQHALLRGVDDRDAVAVGVGDVHAGFAGVHSDGLGAVPDFYGSDYRAFDCVDHGDSVIGGMEGQFEDPTLCYFGFRCWF
jgi:hypothetical protein